MASDRETLRRGFGSSHGRVLDRDLFFFLLDLEVKRARRYQNFLCLMLLRIKPFSKNEVEKERDFDFRILNDILTEETRESDLIGFLERDCFAVLFPYADAKAGNHVKSRFENILRFYDFKDRAFEVVFDQICFPINGADTADLIKRAMNSEPSY